MKKVEISVIIPAFNEEQNIKAGVLEKVYRYLKRQEYIWEVLIVDDESKDETAELAKVFAKSHRGFKVLKEPHRGKGGTVIAGMLAAAGEIILFTDMDQATPLDQLEKFFPKFDEGYEGVIGSRSGRKGAPILRKLMAFGFAVLRTIVLRLPYKDTQCGFKAFRVGAAKKIFSKMKVFREERQIKGASVTAGFDLEMLYIARKLGYKVAEVPVAWSHQETKRVNPLKDSWEGLRDLLKVRINAFQGKYKT
ncbi:MAG: Glycosyl transferase family 2 [Candidatus Woesebacteria bacterium GW2011_GWB1_43_14]|uniref:Glycosyl transferase family 2 n=1 Tax=Candidatus Woesebacteria bacterium GW2011_GWB1_43_14 TaxID=1618578 RepID=A0A0G1DHV1_9BACT|nr:MAG: Glycosyl transferase family 2 [Candidatus Woesebacteria bacterium GW2011_GWA1_39_11b]KKS78313.1 MAG: Glycosyl transferase family 2 [Candidatus Woesebacteria bacterium GW2011_GWC1_42_9]KKS97269.1 MAG: Glycosyl transferase family 2 [Candidatus Woesebacteria bacterium GW2011_GWB1_43_14]